MLCRRGGARGELVLTFPRCFFFFVRTRSGFFPCAAVRVIAGGMREQERCALLPFHIFLCLSFVPHLLSFPFPFIFSFHPSLLWLSILLSLRSTRLIYLSFSHVARRNGQLGGTHQSRSALHSLWFCFFLSFCSPAILHSLFTD